MRLAPQVALADEVTDQKDRRCPVQAAQDRGSVLVHTQKTVVEGEKKGLFWQLDAAVEPVRKLLQRHGVPALRVKQAHLLSKALRADAIFALPVVMGLANAVVHQYGNTCCLIHGALPFGRRPSRVSIWSRSSGHTS